jgi:hypothetical protein
LFLDQSENWDFEGDQLLEIWWDGQIPKITADISLLAAEVTRTIR